VRASFTCVIMNRTLLLCRNFRGVVLKRGYATQATRPFDEDFPKKKTEKQEKGQPSGNINASSVPPKDTNPSSPDGKSKDPWRGNSKTYERSDN